MQFTNNLTNPVKVQYQKVGKQYGIGGDVGPTDTDKESVYPFEEVLVNVGETIELGEVVRVNTVEVTPFSEATQKSLDTMQEMSQRG